MLRNAFAKTLRDLRRALGWWALGTIALCAFIVAVYPSVRDNPELNRMVEDYPDALKAFFGLGQGVDYTSAVGYLDSELFSLMLPLLCVYANFVGIFGGGLVAVMDPPDRLRYSDSV